MRRSLTTGLEHRAIHVALARGTGRLDAYAFEIIDVAILARPLSANRDEPRRQKDRLARAGNPVIAGASIDH